jgi:hypothetical protein
VIEVGKEIGDTGMDALKEAGGAAGEKRDPGSPSGRSPNAAGSGGSQTLVRDDFVQDHEANSKLLEVDSEGDERWVEQAIKDALGRSASNRSSR